MEPYKAIHVLVSFDVKHLDKAQALLGILAKDFPAAEVTSEPIQCPRSRRPTTATSRRR